MSGSRIGNDVQARALVETECDWARRRGREGARREPEGAWREAGLTALNVSLGARSRWSGILAGVWMLAIVLLLPALYLLSYVVMRVSGRALPDPDVPIVDGVGKQGVRIAGIDALARAVLTKALSDAGITGDRFEQAALF